MKRVVVLLHHGTLEAVECERDDVFVLARERSAGICGVFEELSAAEAYIEKHRLPGTTVRPSSAAPGSA